MSILAALVPLLAGPLGLSNPTSAAAPLTGDWRLEGGQAGAQLGSALATADVNGDGFGDLVVGAPRFDDRRQDEGRVQLFLGSAAGLSGTPAWMRFGRQRNAHLGAKIANAGDVNGDGFEDILIGAPDFDRPPLPRDPLFVGALDPHERIPGNEGRIQLFLGSAAGLTAPARTIFGVERGERFGSAIDGVGDVDGDGFGDVIVGATGKSGGRGALLLFDGNASGMGAFPSWIWIGAEPATGLGSLVGAAGDTTGDGFADFVAAMPEAAGCTRLAYFRGSAVGPFLSSLVNDAPAWIGPAADFDDDGQLEQAFAADVDCGLQGQLRWRRLGTGASGYLGGPGHLAAVAAGDLNGDGRPDLVASAPQLDFGPFHGRVYVRLNPPGQMFEEAQAYFPVFDGDQADAGWGEALATADVDGDGSAELFIAAPRQDGAAADEGAVTMVPGWREEIEIEQVSPLSGIFASYRPGGIGDFDGDGLSDLVVLADVSTATLEVRYGSPAGLPETPDATLVPPPLDQISGLFTDFSTGDLNGDGFDDLQVSLLPTFPYFTFDVRHSIYFGSAAGLLVEPALTVLSANSGSEAEIVGDVDGDGFDDLLLGNQVHLGTTGLPVHSQDLQGGAIFASISEVPVGGHRGVLAGDLDGDPYRDVVVARRTNPGLKLLLDVYRGSAQGLVREQIFEPPRIAGPGSFSTLWTHVLALEDLDGDGLDDLVLEYKAGPTTPSPGAELAFFHGSPAGLERAIPWWDYSFEPSGAGVLLVVDADQDGFLDLLLAGDRLHRGSPDGIRRIPAWFEAPSLDLNQSLVTTDGDFDGDGRLEFTMVGIVPAFGFPTLVFGCHAP